MPETGTVTILFTDLVGSTDLLIEIGEQRFDPIREEHDALVGGAITTHRGRVVKDTGDGFMAVFTAAADALAAGIDIQQQMSLRNQESEIPLGVRIGISAGDSTERAGDYHGIPPIEAARLCTAATAGQILASVIIRDLAHAGDDVELVDLGELDLKGLPPVDAVAVRWGPEAPIEGPPRTSGNLPASFDRFIGRENELEALAVLLRDHRLVTLTGPGGSGKTRLALEAAHRIAVQHRDGAWLVELAGIDDEDLVGEATSAALGLRASDMTALEQVAAHLRTKTTLLVLDNCEHLVEAVATFAARLLSKCPGLHVLTTSREPLSIPGEREHPVGSLDPEDATELLVERMSSVGASIVQDRRAIERICTAVDGIPLAIELAAARLRVYSPEQLAERLDDQLAVLTHGGRTRPDRQQTLRATLDWSHDLLEDDEKVAFRRLSVFAGGFTSDAAEQVVADATLERVRIVELIEQLVNRSLVTAEHRATAPRFRMLEPVKQYASELSDASERESLTARHLEWIVRFTRRASLDFFSGQGQVTRRIADEHANICRALEHAIDQAEAMSASRIIDALGYPWYTAGQPGARQWCERTLALVADDAPPMARAGVLLATAMQLEDSLEFDRAEQLLDEACRLYRAAGSHQGEAWAVTWLARSSFYRSPSSPETTALLHDALARHRETGASLGVGWCLALLANGAIHKGDNQLARRYIEEAARIGRSERLGQVLADALRLLAVIEHEEGNIEGSQRCVRELLAIHEAAGDRFQLATAHVSAAELAVASGEVRMAAAHVMAAADLVGEMQSPDRVCEVLGVAALLARGAGRSHEAATLLGARRNRSPATFPKRYRPLLAELEAEGLGEALATGCDLDEGLERARAVVNSLIAAPA